MKILLVALNAKFIHSSLALRTLKAYSTTIAENIETCEFTINNEKEFILSEIYNKHPDAVGFSCYIWNIEMTLHIAEMLKKVLPNVFIFLGGPEVSFESDLLLKENRFIDLVMRGEGEKIFYNTAKSLINGSFDFSSINGVTYRKGEEIVINPPEKELNLNDIPFSCGNLKDTENKIIYYESQRGCPYNCQFCLSSIDGRVRFLSDDRVKSDLDFFLQNNVRQVKFVDRTFNCNKDHAHFIWSYLMAHDNGKTNFHMEIEAHILDDNEIEFLKNARKGLFQFEIGVQSTNNKTLEAVSRSNDFETLRHKVEKIKEGKNIHVHLDLIAGLPYEGYESFKKSFNDVYSLNPEQLQLGFLKLLKGSGLRRNAEKYGIVYDSKAPYEVLYTRDIDFDHMLMLKNIEEMVETYYNSFKIPTTEKYVCGLFKSPFDFYESLATYWVNNGLHRVNHSKQELYVIIYNFCLNSGFSKTEIEIIKDLLKFDMLLSDNLKSMPNFIDESITEEYKAAKRKFFNTQSETEKYMPTLTAFSPQQLSRMCRIEHFKYNILEYINTNEIKAEENDILFNYYNRDIITNHAEITRISL